MSNYNTNVYDDLKLLLCLPCIFLSECTKRTGTASKPKKTAHRITLTKRKRKHRSKTDTGEPDSVTTVSTDCQEITVDALVGILQDPDKGVPRALTTAMKDVKVRKGKVASKVQTNFFPKTCTTFTCIQYVYRRRSSVLWCRHCVVDGGKCGRGGGRGRCRAAGTAAIGQRSYISF